MKKIDALPDLMPLLREAQIDFEQSHDKIVNGYLPMSDNVGGHRRHIFVRIFESKAVAIAILAEDPIGDDPCYNVGFAVDENYRGRGLGVELVNIGVDHVKKSVGKSFYLEAIVDQRNDASIKALKKIFRDQATPMKDDETQIDSLRFFKSVKNETNK